MRVMDVAELRGKIRDIKDFPTEGILFKDITTLLKDGPAWRFAIDRLASQLSDASGSTSWSGSSRAASSSAARSRTSCTAGFVPVRKLGKLPGQDDRGRVRARVRPRRAGHARGRDPARASGSSRSTTSWLPAVPWRPRSRLIEQLGGKVVGVAFMIELAFLHGRDKLKNYPVHSLIGYD